jgi:hypothetical protein
MGPPGTHGGAVTRSILAGGSGPRESLSTAAAVAVEAEVASGRPALLAELSPDSRRRPATLLCSPAARALEAELRGAGLPASARGRLCHLRVSADEEGLAQLATVLPVCGAELAVVQVPPLLWTPALEAGLELRGALLLADPESERSLAALVVAELRARGLRVRVETRPAGPLAGRRALAGVRPGGAASERAARIAAALFR